MLRTRVAGPRELLVALVLPLASSVNSHSLADRITGSRSPQTIVHTHRCSIVLVHWLLPLRPFARTKRCVGPLGT